MAQSRGLGDVVDLLYRLREARLELNRKAEQVAEKERALRAELLSKMARARTSSARGEIASASRYARQIAVVKDPRKLIEYALKEDALDLLTVGAKAEACSERWNDGLVIPGVAPDQVIKISLTKVKKTRG